MPSNHNKGERGSEAACHIRSIRAGKAGVPISTTPALTDADAQ